MDREALAVAVAEILLRRLPENAGDDLIEAIVADLVRLIESSTPAPEGGEEPRHVVITALGRNQTGIVHAFSEILAERNVDIVDVNQTLVHGNFAMMIIANPEGASVSFDELKAELKQRGEERGVTVYVQYEDLMRAVNRI